MGQPLTASHTIRMAALQAATNQSPPGTTPGEVLELAEIFVGWVEGMDAALAIAGATGNWALLDQPRNGDGLKFGLCGVVCPGRTPTRECTRQANHAGAHGFSTDQGWYEFPADSWPWETRTPHPFEVAHTRNCGNIHPQPEVPPCQLPKHHVGGHASFLIDEATRHDWIDEDQVEASQAKGELYRVTQATCGAIGSHGAICKEKAGHMVPHCGPTRTGDNWTWPLHEAKATCPAMKPAPCGYFYCSLRTGHAGAHQDGLEAWEDENTTTGRNPE